MGERPTLAVWKFASCDGCQLSLLDLEDELLGSVTTPDDAERIRTVRAQSRRLVTIGACATAGGIQALRNFADVGDFLSVVYATPEYVSTLETSTPISDHVHVDYELHGCPINKRQLLEVIGAFLHERRPAIPSSSVCLECKRRGNVCVMVAQGTPCLGPVTHAGCGALCPTYDRGCYGCYGPMETPNTTSLSGWLGRLGAEDVDLIRVYRTFNAGAQPFREQSEAHER
jgi:coenzyme F420-reducing hydrogenase gamma subunit